MKKLISWLLLCALLLSLAACGSGGQVVAPTSDSGDWGGRGQPFALKSVELPGQALGLAACGDALCVLVQGEARALYSVEDGQLVQLGYSEADGAAGRMTADESGVWLTLIGAEGSELSLAHYPLDGGSADAYIEPDVQDCTRLAYGGGLIWLYDSALGRLLALKPDGSSTSRSTVLRPLKTGQWPRAGKRCCAARRMASPMPGPAPAQFGPRMTAAGLKQMPTGSGTALKPGARLWPSGLSAASRCLSSQRSHRMARATPS